MGKGERKMSEYGLRQHNRRIGNPETVYRTARYYEVRDNVRMTVRLVLFLGEVCLALAGFGAFFYGVVWLLGRLP
jgi:hypothetical protein